MTIKRGLRDEVSGQQTQRTTDYIKIEPGKSVDFLLSRRSSECAIQYYGHEIWTDVMGDDGKPHRKPYKFKCIQPRDHSVLICPGCQMKQQAEDAGANEESVKALKPRFNAAMTIFVPVVSGGWKEAVYFFGSTVWEQLVKQDAGPVATSSIALAENVDFDPDDGFLYNRVVRVSRVGSGQFDTKYTVDNFAINTTDRKRPGDLPEPELDIMDYTGPVERPAILNLLARGFDISSLLQNNEKLEDYTEKASAPEEQVKDAEQTASNAEAVAPAEEQTKAKKPKGSEKSTADWGQL